MREIILLFLVFVIAVVQGQDCTGGSIATNEAFLYGRFEVSMKSAIGSGIVSSFFLYNLDLGCNWPAENNEIDIEMTGNDTDIDFTTHYPGPWSHNDNIDFGFDPHANFHEYAFEWEPGIVRWFVDGQLANVQDQSFVAQLIHPMRLIMNLWAADAPSWVGNWDPIVMPSKSEYQWVKYYERTPGSGNYGTNDNFTFVWEEQFDTLNSDRWTISRFGGFDGNFCTFKTAGVEVGNGLLTLHITEPADPIMVPVTFAVDTRDLNLTPNDQIYLNGGFNNWCGNCDPMVLQNGIWTKTLMIESGEHQYLFTKNLWEENGGAPLGSQCDYKPCDEWQNYGFVLEDTATYLKLDTFCWKTCHSCDEDSIPSSILINLPEGLEKEVIKVYDLLGRETIEQQGELLLYQYGNGAIRREIKR